MGRILKPAYSTHIHHMQHIHIDDNNIKNHDNYIKPTTNYTTVDKFNTSIRSSTAGSGTNRIGTVGSNGGAAGRVSDGGGQRSRPGVGMAGTVEVRLRVRPGNAPPGRARSAWAGRGRV
jgi:hypothetical protein